MGLFKKKEEAPPAPQPTVAEKLEALIASPDAQPSLTAHSEFVKRVNCSRCGAPKKLPSKTAYLYCDYCGCLVDYDFRMANAGTNAGLTNTVFHQLVAGVQADLNKARVTLDRDAYRELLEGVFAEWIQQCPQAVSPRARTDEDFRARMVAYMAASAVSKDFDPRQASLDATMNAQINALQRRPNPPGPWLVSDGIWKVAETFKEQMRMAYELIQSSGVAALDPDEAPPEVALRMEYSTFCQGWLPHLVPGDGERLLNEFGLDGSYAHAEVIDTISNRCGGCGDDLKTLPDASAVVCESCGRKLDVGGAAAPCQSCGAALAWPVGESSLECPYCHARTSRV